MVCFEGNFYVWFFAGVEGRVGFKGELLPLKDVGDRLGLKPHMRVVYGVEDGRLIVEPIPSLELSVNRIWSR